MIFLDLDCCFQGGENKTARKKRVVIRTDRKRQQCKTAARSRRLTEADLFGQLTQTLPVVDQPTIYQLDRIAAVRLASMLCRTRVVAEKCKTCEFGIWGLVCTRGFNTFAL